MTQPPPPPPDRQLLRATANALWWPFLKRGRWLPARAYAVNDERGNPRNNTATTARFPRPESNPRVELLSSQPYAREYVWPEDHPAYTAHVVQLLKSDHDHVVAGLPEPQRLGYLAAQKLAVCRMPFEVTENRHGRRMLRRNSHDGGLTQAAAQALEAIASAAAILPLTVEDLRGLDAIRDIEIDLAAAERIRRAG